MGIFMKKTLFIIVATVLTVGAIAAEISLKKNVIKRQGHDFYRYDIRGGKYKQAFNYIIFQGKNGPALSNVAGNACGLTYGWFGSGMISVVVNGKVQLMSQSFKIEEGKDYFKFNLDGKGYKGELTFKFIPNSDLIKGRIKVEPADAIKRLIVNLYAVPGHNQHTVEGKKEFKRLYTTAVRNGKLDKGQAIVIDKNKENWIALYDEYNDSTGTAVLLFAPEKVKSVKVTGQGRLVLAGVELPAGQNEFSFLLRGIPTSYLDEDEVVEDMKKNSAKMMKNL
jgi:hypothetical protein